MSWFFGVTPEEVDTPEMRPLQPLRPTLGSWVRMVGRTQFWGLDGLVVGVSRDREWVTVEWPGSGHRRNRVPMSALTLASSAREAGQ